MSSLDLFNLTSASLEGVVEHVEDVPPGRGGLAELSEAEIAMIPPVLVGVRLYEPEACKLSSTQAPAEERIEVQESRRRQLVGCL